MEEGIVVVSCFDGMACLYLALKKAGIKVKKYFAYEIDKYAIKVAKANFPDIIHLGDITKASVKDFEGLHIDLFCGGSPCQGFSFAGKQLAFDDPRSKLFFEFVRLKNECTPTYFLLENVQMKKEHELVISQYMNIAPIQINSALLSAQNRQRLYWTNINNQTYGLFNEVKCMIPQPKDKGILLGDILETEVDEKYYLSEGMLKYFSKRAANFNDGKVNIREAEGKASCLTSSMASCDISDNFICVDANGRESTEKTGTISSRYSKGVQNFGSDPFIKITTALKPSTNQNKADCITAGGKSGGLHSDMSLIIQNTKDNHVVYAADYRNDEGIRIRQSQKAPTLTSGSQNSGTQLNSLAIKNGRIKRLTPTECDRLQTIPEWYKWEMVGQFTKIYYLCDELKYNKLWDKINVKMTDAQIQLQLNKLNYALNVTSEDNVKVHWKFQDQLSINQSNVMCLGVKETNKHKMVYVSCTTNGLLELGQQNCLRIILKNMQNVHIAIRRLGRVGQKECVQNTTKCTDYTKTHCILKVKEVFQVQADIYEIQMEFVFMLELWKRISGELLKKERLSTILIPLKQIMKSVICTYAKVNPSIHLSMRKLELSQKMELTSHVYLLQTENTYTSDSAIYRMLGNGWTVDVIAHILSFAKFNN